ncbi:MAG: protein-L-isoaspartate O-methyltransferase family protein, partial [Actinomycetes bacterium]
MANSDALRQAMVEGLTQRGELEARWRAAFSEVLTALQVAPGMRVLEIGTGTGYNAALLAHQLGAAHVVSVEIDPVVAEHARHALAATGYRAVSVITGDGAEGYPPGAPYD